MSDTLVKRMSDTEITAVMLIFWLLILVAVAGFR